MTDPRRTLVIELPLPPDSQPQGELVETVKREAKKAGLPQPLIRVVESYTLPCPVCNSSPECQPSCPEKGRFVAPVEVR